MARALVAEGAEVRILDNFLTGFEANVPAKAELIRGDLRDAAQLRPPAEKSTSSFTKVHSRNVIKSREDPLLPESCNAVG